MPNRYRYLRSIRTYEDLAEAIYFSITDCDVLKVAKYRPGKNYTHLQKAAAEGFLRGCMSFQEQMVEAGKSIEPIVIMKSDTWLRRLWRRLRAT